MQTDLTYTRCGMFTRFIPNTPEGEKAWRVMAAEDGCAAVLTMHEKATIAQIRAAGYTVSKSKAAPVKAGEIDNLLKELGL
jgi:hypothetical protein